MCKSLDSAAVITKTLLSIYREQGKSGRQLNTPSKIYAPDGTFEGTDVNLKLSRTISDRYKLCYFGSSLSSFLSFLKSKIILIFFKLKFFF